MADKKGMSGSACPVAHNGSALPEGHPPVPMATTTTSTTPAPECPVMHGDAKKPSAPGTEPPKRKVYNVYAQLIDPSNQMPANPNQEPAPGQRIPLSTDRVKSQIPKGGTDQDTWLYPSPQMFFNALRRKGKDDGFREESAELVVAIHNNMNERTWREVVKWEQQYCDVCPTPKLLKFMGRPDELSPKARMKTWFGWITPFDRHDWTIDRCGKEVRYVIDYYYDDGSAHLDQRPALGDAESVKSIAVDVRPAVDSFESFVDRLRHFPKRMSEAWERGGSRFLESHQRDVQQAQKILAEKTKADFEAIQTKCAARFQEMKECKDDIACERATMGMNYCMAQVVCPNEAKEFIAAMEKATDGKAVEAAYHSMDQCLWRFGVKAGRDLRNVE